MKSRHYRLLLVLLLVCQIPFSVFGQAHTGVYHNEQVANENFQVVLVDVEHYVELKVQTIDSDNLYASSDFQYGEYDGAISWTSRVERDTLFITDPINIQFEFPQDKLSAHKLTDSRASLAIPQNKVLFLNLKNANVTMSGDYQEIILNIDSGKVYLDKITGNTQIVSIDADIVGKDLENYSIAASSRNGKVVTKPSNTSKRYSLTVETIRGDIDLE